MYGAATAEAGTAGAAATAAGGASAARAVSRRAAAVTAAKTCGAHRSSDPRGPTLSAVACGRTPRMEGLHKMPMKPRRGITRTRDGCSKSPVLTHRSIAFGVHEPLLGDCLTELWLPGRLHNFPF